MIKVFTCFSSASVFSSCVLDGFAASRLGLRSILAFFALYRFALPANHGPWWLPPWPHGRHCPFVFDAALLKIDLASRVEHS